MNITLPLKVTALQLAITFASDYWLYTISFSLLKSLITRKSIKETIRGVFSIKSVYRLTCKSIYATTETEVIFSVKFELILASWLQPLASFKIG